MTPGTGNRPACAWSAFPFLLILVFLAGCATPPLDIPETVGEPVEPRAVTAAMLPIDDQVWGGVIARTENRADVTVLEVVSYPLHRQEPQTRQANTGRFRLKVEGFLDPVDYRAGRRITAVGSVTGMEAGRIGQLDYDFPLLEAYTLHLWPDPVPADPGRVRFGIGIGIGF